MKLRILGNKHCLFFSWLGNFFGSTTTEGTSTLVEAGLNLNVGKFGVFGGVKWQDGGTPESFTGGQLVVRYSW